MRRMISLSLIFSIFLFFSSQAYTSDDYYSNSGEKFMNGIVNAATGWIELPKNIILISQKEGPVYGVTLGIAMGTMHLVGRSLGGILNAATFFIPTKPSINPPFVWQDFSVETTY